MAHQTTHRIVITDPASANASTIDKILADAQAQLAKLEGVSTRSRKIDEKESAERRAARRAERAAARATNETPTEDKPE